MLGSSVTALHLGQHENGSVVNMTSGICDGKTSHDYGVVEEGDDSATFECRRCGARMIEYPE